MTALDVLREFYPELVSSLPMKDDVFIDMLDKKGLFFGNVSAAVQSKPTAADAAVYFIDNVIERSLRGSSVYTELFEKLLVVMEEFNTQSLKQLATSIKQKLKGEMLGISRSGPFLNILQGKHFFTRKSIIWPLPTLLLTLAITLQCIHVKAMGLYIPPSYYVYHV